MEVCRAFSLIVMEMRQLPELKQWVKNLSSRFVEWGEGAVKGISSKQHHNYCKLLQIQSEKSKEIHGKANSHYWEIQENPRKRTSNFNSATALVRPATKLATGTCSNSWLAPKWETHTHMRGVWLKGFSLVEKGRGGLEEDTPLLATKDKEECANFGSKVGGKEN